MLDVVFRPRYFYYYCTLVQLLCVYFHFLVQIGTLGVAAVANQSRTEEKSLSHFTPDNLVYINTGLVGATRAMNGANVAC